MTWEEERGGEKRRRSAPEARAPEADPIMVPDVTPVLQPASSPCVVGTWLFLVTTAMFPIFTVIEHVGASAILSWAMFG